MNLEKYKEQHHLILGGIAELRALAKAGVEKNASHIAATVVSMSSTIRLHLAVEDRSLYPALRAGSDGVLSRLGQRYQAEMNSIAELYLSFARKWNTGANVAGDPQGFRNEANAVLKTLHQRIRQEDTEFYPAIEAHRA